MNQSLLTHAPTGTKPATQACALTRKRTSDLSLWDNAQPTQPTLVRARPESEVALCDHVEPKIKTRVLSLAYLVTSRTSAISMSSCSPQAYLPRPKRQKKWLCTKTIK